MGLKPAPTPDELALVLELAELEHATWPARSRALHASGVPLNEDPPKDPPADPPKDPAPKDPPSDPPAHPPADPPKDPEVFDRAYVEQLRRENASYRTKAQQLEQEKQAREDAEKTEAQREKDRADRAEARAKELEQDKLRREAADKHNLPASLVSRLRGDTAEALDADAQALAAEVAIPPRRGTPDDHGAGNRGGAPPAETDAETETDPAKVRARARKARRRSTTTD